MHGRYSLNPLQIVESIASRVVYEESAEHRVPIGRLDSLNQPHLASLLLLGQEVVLLFLKHSTIETW